jgi:hypothetical protein
MVEIEWDGVELSSEARRSLLERLRGLASLVDPDGRARVEVVIEREASGYCVHVEGHDEQHRMGAEVRDSDVADAIARAIDLASARWEAAARRRAA